MYFLCIIYVLSVKGNKRGTEGEPKGNWMGTEREPEIQDLIYSNCLKENKSM